MAQDSIIGRRFGDCLIQEKIAIGGFGTVYKAIDEKLYIPRAVKIFHPHLSGEKGFTKRVETEIRLLAALDHPNIVRIVNAIDEEDFTGFVMEFVEGETLNDIIENEGPLDIPRVMDIFTQVLRSIAYAHNLKQQIIHRDLSPDNIMIRPDRVVKIMDFGIAKTLGAEQVTQTGIVLGKPSYMAPEQFEGKVTIYTDQYALGIILYEMVTGQVPFQADAPIALYKLHLNEPPVPPSQLVDGIPRNIELTILKALEKDEKDRFNSVDEMLQMLLAGEQEVITVSPTERKKVTLLSAAEAALQSKNYDEALVKFEEVLLIEPNNPKALSGRERVQRAIKRSEELDKLEQLFHQAVAVYDQGNTQQALLYVKDFLKIAGVLGKEEQAVKFRRFLDRKMPKIVKQAVDLEKEDYKKAEQIKKAGKKFFQKGKYTDALKKFQEALDLAPENELTMKLKVLCEKKIKVEDVTQHYREGIMALQNQKFEKAIAAFAKVLELHPNHKDALKYKQLAESELRKIEAERSSQEHARQEIETLFQEGMVFYDRWEYAKAFQKFQQVLLLDKKHPEANRLIAECQARMQDEDKIHELSFFYNQGLTLFKSKKWKEAIACFDRVLEQMDGHKGALEHKEKAEKELVKHQDVRGLADEAFEKFRCSAYEEALAKFDQLLSLDKNNKEAQKYRTLCQELINLNRR